MKMVGKCFLTRYFLAYNNAHKDIYLMAKLALTLSNVLVLSGCYPSKHFPSKGIEEDAAQKDVFCDGNNAWKNLQDMHCTVTEQNTVL